MFSYFSNDSAYATILGLLKLRTKIRQGITMIQNCSKWKEIGTALLVRIFCLWHGSVVTRHVHSNWNVPDSLPDIIIRNPKKVNY